MTCSCQKKCKTIDEMQAAHGTPEQYAKALNAAFIDGFISIAELDAAEERYRQEWTAMMAQREMN